MIMNEEMSTYPEEVVVCVLPDNEGTDIWIRKNILETKKIIEDTEQVSYTSTSAYMRTIGIVSKEDVENNISYYWEMAKNWEPSNDFIGIDETTKNYIDKKINEMFSTIITVYQGGVK